ncbi:MAG: response regulator [Desulfobulbaceae bacterium]|nr:response regulator [Desulfobulbaceae bacterium]
MSINNKIIPAVLALAVLPLLLFGYFCIERATVVIERYVLHEVEGQANGVAKSLLADRLLTTTTTFDAALRTDLQNFVVSYNHLSGRDIVIIDRARTVLADAEPHNLGSRYPHFSNDQAQITAILEQVLQGKSRGEFVERSDDGNFNLIAVPVLGDGKEVVGAVILEYSALYQAALTMEKELRRTLAAGNLVIAALALLLAFYLSRQITRPVRELSLVAKALGEGDFSRQAVVDSADELGELATTFNKMAASLARLLEQERVATEQVAVSNEQLRQEMGERLGAEQALRESEELYRSLVENIDLGVVLINREHEIVMANSATGQPFNKKPAELAGRKCYREFEKREQVCAHCPGVRAMQELQVCETDVEAARPDGVTVVMRIRAFPVRDRDGRATGFIEVTEDITERRKLEEELRRAKHLESIGTLAGGIAHDFNNLLAGILGNIALARLYIGKPEKSLEKLQICEKAVMRGRDLSQQLLTFAKGGTPIKENVAVAELLREAVTFALSGANVSCAYDLPVDLWPAELDSGQISQVFQNLVANSVQAMPAGGTLEVSACNLLVTDPAEALPAGRYLKISLRDHGPGIAPEHLDKIFLPFFTTKKKGSGLGLAICYSIVKKHQGRIEVVATDGGGATFQVFLPASECQPVLTTDESGRLPEGEGRILVMDDEEVVRESAAEMLSYLGYKVEIAGDGLEALDHYRKAAAAGQGYDVVILDLTVPGGIGGLETLRKLVEYDPGVRAVVSSGYANDAVLADYRQYGFRGLICKPYSLKELGEVVAEVLAPGV